MAALSGSRDEWIGVGIIGLGDGGMSNLRSFVRLTEGDMRRDMMGVGVIDAGEEGRWNMQALDILAGVEVVALCDVNEGRLQLACGELSRDIRRYRHHIELVTDPEVNLIVVATPDHMHLVPTQDALEAGKYVFVEKPVAVTMDALASFRMLTAQYPDKIFFGEKYSHARPIEAALKYRDELGRFQWGSTLYTMWRCDRIMGPEGWRVHTPYNPAAGGLSHNFMTALLFDGSRITRISAIGRILSYEELRQHGGFDTMQGTLEFESGACLTWAVCLAVRSDDSPLHHRTIAHLFQFQGGVLVYGPTPGADHVFVRGYPKMFQVEEYEPEWSSYNIGELYGRMHADILVAIRDGRKPRHTIEQGINVAAACALAFESAHEDGVWKEVPF